MNNEGNKRLGTWEWFTRGMAAIAFGLSLFTFWSGQKTKRTADSLSVSKIVDEAVDLLDQAQPHGYRSGSTEEHLKREKAKRKLNEGLALSPKSPKVHWALGRYFLYEQKFTDAFNEEDQATKSDPNNSAYWTELGIVLYTQKKYDDSKKALERAIECDAKNWYAYNSLGQLDERLRLLDQAEDAYGTAIKVAPEDALGYYNKAHLLIDRGRYPEAADFAHEAIAQDPRHLPGQNNLYAYIDLAYVLTKLGKPEEAASYYRQALDLDRGDPIALSSLGVNYRRRGKVDEAISLYKESIERNPHYANTHYDLAMALLQKGQKDQAAAELNRALKLDPNLARAREVLGKLEAATPPESNDPNPRLDK